MLTVTPSLALPIFTDSFTCGDRRQALRVNTKSSTLVQFNPTSYDASVEFVDGSTGKAGAIKVALNCLSSFVPTNDYTDCWIDDSSLVS